MECSEVLPSSFGPGKNEFLNTSGLNPTQKLELWMHFGQIPSYCTYIQVSVCIWETGEKSVFTDFIWLLQQPALA